jgi:hypothetical protein
LFKNSIRSHQHQFLATRLRNQHPVKWIAMVKHQFPNRQGVRMRNRERLE